MQQYGGSTASSSRSKHVRKQGRGVLLEQQPAAIVQQLMPIVRQSWMPWVMDGEDGAAVDLRSRPVRLTPGFGAATSDAVTAGVIATGGQERSSSGGLIHEWSALRVRAAALGDARAAVLMLRVRRYAGGRCAVLGTEHDSIFSIEDR